MALDGDMDVFVFQSEHDNIDADLEFLGTMDICETYAWLEFQSYRLMAKVLYPRDKEFDNENYPLFEYDYCVYGNEIKIDPEKDIHFLINWEVEECSYLEDVEEVKMLAHTFTPEQIKGDNFIKRYLNIERNNGSTKLDIIDDMKTCIPGSYNNCNSQVLEEMELILKIVKETTNAEEAFTCVSRRFEIMGMDGSMGVVVFECKGDDLSTLNILHSTSMEDRYRRLDNHFDNMVSSIFNGDDTWGFENILKDLKDGYDIHLMAHFNKENGWNDFAFPQFKFMSFKGTSVSECTNKLDIIGERATVSIKDEIVDAYELLYDHQVSTVFDAVEVNPIYRQMNYMFVREEIEDHPVRFCEVSYNSTKDDNFYGLYYKYILLRSSDLQHMIDKLPEKFMRKLFKQWLFFFDSEFSSKVDRHGVGGYRNRVDAMNPPKYRFYDLFSPIFYYKSPYNNKEARTKVIAEANEFIAELNVASDSKSEDEYWKAFKKMIELDMFHITLPFPVFELNEGETIDEMLYRLSGRKEKFGALSIIRKVKEPNSNCLDTAYVIYDDSANALYNIYNTSYADNYDAEFTLPKGFFSELLKNSAKVLSIINKLGISTYKSPEQLHRKNADLYKTEEFSIEEAINLY